MKSKFLSITFLSLILLLVACSDMNDNSNDGDESKVETGDMDPFGKYEEPITIAIGAEVDPSDTSLEEGETPLDNKFVNHVKENLNINVEHYFTASPSNIDQKKSLAISSNDLPDAMTVGPVELRQMVELDRKSTRLNSSHVAISYAVFCLKKKKVIHHTSKPRTHNYTYTG